MTPTVYGTHTPDEWEREDGWSGDNYAVTDDGVVVAPGLTPTYVDPVELGAEFERIDTVDIALDDCETLYALTDTGAVYSDDRTDGVLDLFVGPDSDERLAAIEPRTLGVTADTVYLVSGDGRVVAVSRPMGTVRWVLDPGTPLVDPIGTVADSRYAYILDRRPGGGVVVRVNRDGETVEILPGPDAAPGTTLSEPRDLARDDEWNLYVLHEGQEDSGETRPRISRFDQDPESPTGYSATPVVVSVPVEFDPACLAAVGTGELLFGQTQHAEGRRTLIRYLPDRGTFEHVSTFEGVCTALVLRRGTRGRSRGLYVLEQGLDSVAVASIRFLEEAVTNRLSDRTGRYEARVIRRFDAGSVAVRWHRITVDFTLAGAGTQLRLQYFATDDDVSADTVSWRPLDKPNPSDALLPDAKGRYLWVALDIVGTEMRSPTVRAFQVYFPRSSYLRYLPAVYQEDPASADFLERFLSVFESVYLDIETEIDDLTGLLDANGIDAAYLDWLEGWLALDLDESWTEESRRELLRQAPELFKSRGTRAGLLAVLRLYLAGIEAPRMDDDAWERAREHERGLLDGLVADGTLDDESRDELEARLETAHESLRTAHDVELLYLLEERDLDCIDTDAAREPYRRLVPCPQCFVVLVAPYVDDEQLRTVDRIVRSERPAHAVGRGMGLNPWIELGGHSYLGVNTALSSRPFVLEQSTLGRDSTLVDRVDETGQAGDSLMSPHDI